MQKFVVMRFRSADGAERAMGTLADLARQHLIQIADAAIVEWKEGKKRPKTRQLRDLAGVGAVSGAFWGLLFGMIFFVPFLGAAVGAAMGALGGSMRNFGITEDLIKQCRARITPGSSALFVLAQTDAADKVIAAMKPHEPEIIQTNLSNEEEDALRAAFEEEA